MAGYRGDAKDQYQPQDECEDKIFHVTCHHCGMEVDPYEEPVYCWNIGLDDLCDHAEEYKQIFACRGCDAEHRTNYSITLKVKEALKETGDAS